jgi:Ni,Fe-hydrogenase I large subunit|tara:strand:+ start:3285 stop:3806 length:522 start_codon:yes stop_codon:yes gene_type:complete
MIIAIVLLSIGFVVTLIAFLHHKDKCKLADKRLSDYIENVQANKKRPILKKGTKGITRFGVYKHFNKLGAHSPEMVQVEVQVKLVSVFDNRAIVEVISVHGHVSPISSGKWLNRMNQNVDVDDVKWECNVQNVEVTDDDIIELYREKKLKVGGLDLKYTGESSPIELIDKLIV